MRRIFKFTFNNIPKSLIVSNIRSFCKYIPLKGKIEYSREFGMIVDLDDPLELNYIKDPISILNHLKDNIELYTFKELTYFLIRISSECKNNNSLPNDIKNNSSYKKLINEIRKRLVLSDHEKYPFFGTVLYHLKKLDVNDKVLVRKILENISEGKWKSNFTESVFALEGTSNISKYNIDSEIVSEALDQIEIAVEKTIWEENMIKYKRILDALVESQRRPLALLFKVQNHIINNLSMEYDIETIASILINMGRLNYGSKELYNALQITLYMGHSFRNNIPFFSNKILLSNRGDILASIIETYHKAVEMNPDLKLHPDFRAYVYNFLIHPKTTYKLDDLSKIFSTIDVFKFEEMDEIENNVFMKALEIKDCSFSEIVYFYSILLQFNIKFSKELIQHFEDIIIKNINNESIDAKLNLIGFLAHQALYHDKKKLFETFLKNFDNNFSQLEYHQLAHIFKLTVGIESKSESLAEIIKGLKGQCKDIFRLRFDEKKGRILLE